MRPVPGGAGLIAVVGEFFAKPTHALHRVRYKRRMIWVYYVVSLAIFVFLVADIWKTNAPQNTKILWTVFAFFCSILALVIWFVSEKKKYQGGIV